MVANNTQKIPLTASIAAAGIRSSQNRFFRAGKCYPCTVAAVSGAIITVNFEMQSDIYNLPQVKMPLFGPEYIRYPIQVGDKGMAIPADAYLGEMTGLGIGRAGFNEMPNLSTLMFMPLGNKNWQSVDAQSVTLYGPNGVVLRDSRSNVTLTLTPSGVTINMGGHGPVTIQNGDLHVTGAIIAGYGGADQVTVQQHRHGTVGTSAAATSVPSPGT